MRQRNGAIKMDKLIQYAKCGDISGAIAFKTFVGSKSGPGQVLFFKLMILQEPPQAIQGRKNVFSMYFSRDFADISNWKKLIVALQIDNCAYMLSRRATVGCCHSIAQESHLPTPFELLYTSVQLCKEQLGVPSL
ncbi:hypothetical protein WA026_016243 [Henosepilachna vigintioctopunctata]|uniref:Uncharacterized protein n=1 Tax=Henosepilachna vigintioctopunctata TaxID=420089 RepID=A0AAW1TUB3_9CUCU